MKVRVKEGCIGTYGIEQRREGDEFEIVAKTHSVEKDSEGNPVVITEEEQFSHRWMIRLDEPKSKPGPKAKAKPGPKPKVSPEPEVEKATQE